MSIFILLHILLHMWLLTHTGIKVTYANKRALMFNTVGPEQKYADIFQIKYKNAFCLMTIWFKS